MISHRHRCIFIHVPKTAGKSVLALFGLPELGRDYVDRLPHIEDPYDHVPAASYVDAPFFRKYFKFAVVRNPWDRLVSAFSYLDAGGCNRFDAEYRAQHLARYQGDFQAFVRDLPRFVGHKHFVPQHEFLCDAGGTILVDEVIRYEELGPSIERLRARLRLDSGPLPHRNKSQHKPYRQHYTADTWRRVAEVYARDIATFGYPPGFDERPVT